MSVKRRDRKNKILRDGETQCKDGQMPKVTPHVCRHTYCSNCARAGMTPKTLQYLRGHSDIGVTLNVYTHLGYEDAKEELSRINMAGAFQSHACRKQA